MTGCATHNQQLTKNKNQPGPGQGPGREGVKETSGNDTDVSFTPVPQKPTKANPFFKGQTDDEDAEEEAAQEYEEH